VRRADGALRALGDEATIRRRDEIHVGLGFRRASGHRRKTAAVLSRATAAQMSSRGSGSEVFARQPLRSRRAAAARPVRRAHAALRALGDEATIRRRDEFISNAGVRVGELAMLRVPSPLTEREEEVYSLAMDCAFAVHRELGPGFKERIYEEAFCLELNARSIRFEREKKIDVRYKSWTIPGQRIDLVVEGLVLVEIKAVSKLIRIYERQVRSYLKTTGLRGGLLVNFNVTMLKNGMRRIVQT
jgi:GxxExxY protein